ncbi:hypothetical protein DHEL01_v210296 [Diaporthe helianthi]|uniref:Major facilitator superfamily transporter n=1 Tax=Diaporthe helianthi TaxID=158607 RepID=A0A2P5HM43_DIAHE|nr:hypothetical protein DHEL01_v210296 [Diaporthe helianthi]
MSTLRALQEPAQGQGERSTLLRTKPVTSNRRATSIRIVPDEYVHRVLFLSFSASVGMAATAATTVFAYALIMCEDPAHCQGEEKAAYAGAVALAVGIANLCVWLKSIHLAIFARIFEGFATDNLLHYTLSVIYVSIADKTRFSRLTGYSLALFMVGMSISPTVAGLLPNFFASFAMALVMFGISLLYLGVLVPVVTIPNANTQSSWAVPAASLGANEDSSWRFDVRRSFQPFKEMCQEAPVAMSGVALLLSNTTQAYLFPAVMVYTSTKFSFTNTQNGYLVSIAATVTAMYLLVVHYVKPRIHMFWRCSSQRDKSPQTQAQATDFARPGADARQHNGSTDVGNDQGQPLPGSETDTAVSKADFIGAIMSLSIEVSVLPCMALAGEAWQVYALVSVVALGLAAPSFIKSYAVSMARNKSTAVASLAMMESMGGLLSTIIWGAWQRWTGGGESVFFVASAVVGASLVSMFASQYVISFV